MAKIVVIDNPILHLVVTNKEEIKLIRTIDEHRIVPVDDTIGRTFTNLTDCPSSYAGKAGSFVAVNTTEQGLTFVDISEELDDCVAYALIFGS